MAVAALDRFFLSLGSFAGDLALAQGANAVVIAGGLGYRLRDRFAASGFAGRFVAKGRFEQRMRAIPVKLLNHPQPGLLRCGCGLREGASMNIDADHEPMPRSSRCWCSTDRSIRVALAETLVEAGLPVIEVTLRTAIGARCNPGDGGR